MKKFSRPPPIPENAVEQPWHEVILTYSNMDWRDLRRVINALIPASVEANVPVHVSAIAVGILMDAGITLARAIERIEALLGELGTKAPLWEILGLLNSQAAMQNRSIGQMFDNIDVGVTARHLCLSGRLEKMAKINAKVLDAAKTHEGPNIVSYDINADLKEVLDEQAKAIAQYQKDKPCNQKTEAN